MAIKVYDINGKERDMAYLKAKFGNFVIHPAAAGPGWRITTLRERDGIAAIIQSGKLPDGSPATGIKVAWYWPDAPEDPRAGPANGLPAGMVPNRCFVGVLNESGDCGHPMGQGAYYWPDRGEVGPHACWMYGSGTNSDVLAFIGMIAATNHLHFDPEFTWVEEPVEPPVDPPVEPPSDFETRVLWCLDEILRRLPSPT